MHVRHVITAILPPAHIVISTFATFNFRYMIKLTLSAMAGFHTHISKCSEKGVKLHFMIFFIGASATKRFARSRINRYWCLMIILSNRQKEREGGPPWLKGLTY